MSSMITLEGMAWGEYGLHAAGQKVVCDALYKNYTERELEHQLQEGKTCVRLADFGAADCVNTAEIYKKILEKVQTQDGGNVVFYINDLPNNDWEMARKVCAPLGIPIVDEKNDDGVTGSRFEFVYGDFYKQCLPFESIDISLCSTANHWLSSGEGLSLPGSLLHFAHEERTSAESRNAIAKRSLEDGVNFLVSRAHELIPGGYLFMGSVITVEKEDGIKEAFARGLAEVMNDILVKYVEKGTLSQAQVDQLTIPCYCKSEAEWRQCFEDSRVKEAGLEMKNGKTVFHENLYYYKLYTKGEDEQSIESIEGIEKAQRFATEYVKCWFAFAGRIFTSIFQSKLKLRAFTDEVIQTVAAQPHNFKVGAAVNFIAAQKRGRGGLRK